MKIVSALLCAGAFAMSAGAVSAASVDFNVSANWSRTGIDYGPVTVTGATMTEGGRILTNNEWVRSWSGYHGGLGVTSASCTTYGSYEGRCDQHTIDGRGNNEMALLSFGSMNVEITSVTFSYWDRNDDFDVAVFDSLAVGSQGSPFYDDVDWGGNGSPRTFNIREGALVGSFFGFGADGPSDEFKLSSITYREISEVPLPAGAVLLLTGIAGFGAMRRRKKAA